MTHKRVLVALLLGFLSKVRASREMEDGLSHDFFTREKKQINDELKASLVGLKIVQPVIGGDSFDLIEDYGAKGDGETDDTYALQQALDDCAASRNGGGTIKLAQGYDFLSGPVLVTGSGCALRLEGKLSQKYWEPSRISEADSGGFITVDGVTDFVMYGGGMVDGNGPEWWIQDKDDEDARPKLLDVKKGSSNLALYNITFYNSADHTLEIDADNTEIAFVNISVDWYVDDGHAPNTDGIDVHGSPFYIHDCSIDVGDDNVAFHADDILVEDCIFGSDSGPDDAVHGHGASIGSLGSDTFISNVTVRNVVFKRTEYGPRIKIHSDATNGKVHDVTYEHLYIDSVKHAIYVTVDYTLASSPPATTARNTHNDQKPYVLQNITFKNITMVNTEIPGDFECSEVTPCLDFHLIDITADDNTVDDWQCSHLYGTQENVSPSSCIQAGSPSSYSYVYYDDDDKNEEEEASLHLSRLGQGEPNSRVQ